MPQRSRPLPRRTSSPLRVRMGIDLPRERRKTYQPPRRRDGDGLCGRVYYAAGVRVRGASEIFD